MTSESGTLKIDYNNQMWLLVENPKENLLKLSQKVSRVQMELYQGGDYLPEVNTRLYLKEHPIPSDFFRILVKDFEHDVYVARETYFVRVGHFHFVPKEEVK